MRATLQVIVNGGAPQTGGIDVADGDVIQLTAASKVGWGNPATRWEIYDCPDGFTPAGWTADPSGVGFYYLGSADPPSFTMDGALWGKYVTRLTGPDGDVDERTMLCLPSTSGLRSLGRRESTQFGGETRGWIGEYQDDLRRIEGTIGSVVAYGDPASDADQDILVSMLAGMSDGDVRVLSGTFYVQDPILIQSLNRVTLKAGPRGAVIRLGNNWSGTGVESDSNYPFRVVPTALAPTTTITATSTQTSPSVTVASATGFATGTFFSIDGTANDAYDSSGGTEREILKCASVGGLVITHAWPQNGYHGSTRTVTRYSGVTEGITFEGIEFDLYSTAGKYAAGAIYCDRQKDTTIRRCAVQGATWVAFNAFACRGWLLVDTIDLGANNMLFDMVHTQVCTARTVENRMRVYERKSTKGGKARWHGGWRQKVRHCSIENMSFQHVAGGFRVWGGMNCSLEGRVYDVDSTDIKTDAPDDTINIPHGMVLDTAANALAVAEFGRFTRFQVVSGEAYMGVGEDYATPMANMYCIAYLHDYDGAHTTLVHSNKGSGHFVTREARLGINVTDFSGFVDTTIEGVGIGLVTNNAYANVTGRMVFSGRAGAGTATGYCWGNMAADRAPQLDYLRFDGDWTFQFFCSHVATITPGALKLPFAREMLFTMVFNDPTIPGNPRGANNQDTWRATDVLMGRAPNSTANWTGPDRYLWNGRIFPQDDTLAQDLRQITVATAAATPRPLICVIMMPNDAGGVERGMLLVEGHEGAICPVRVDTGAPILGRVRIDSDANGFGRAQGAFNSDQLVGRTSCRYPTIGYVQLS